jgi:multisubunit Na+/H+ antiporter MnhF subunit
MSTISHPPSEALRETRHWSELLVVELWAALAIVAMWVAVAVTAVWGTDFVSQSAGGNSTRIPSAIAVALLASIGTWAVAKYGFAQRQRHEG